MTDDKSHIGTENGEQPPHSENPAPSSPKAKYVKKRERDDEPQRGTTRRGPFPKDPETGISVKKNGELFASTGHGPNIKAKIIPPVDMQELVDRGIAPTLYANWDPNDPDSNWLISYRKLTPERKQKYLTALEQYGIQAVAARWAGVSVITVRAHRKEDPLFDEACREAENYYHALTAASILQQARMGQIDERYDKEGNLLSRRVTYEQQLRIRMVERALPEYRAVEKQELTVTGGAVVVPAPVEGTETWDDVVKKYTGGAAGGESKPDVGAITTSGESVGEK